MSVVKERLTITGGKGVRNEWDEGRSGNGQGRELTIRDASYLCPSPVSLILSFHSPSPYAFGYGIRSETEDDGRRREWGEGWI